MKFIQISSIAAFLLSLVFVNPATQAAVINYSGANNLKASAVFSLEDATTLKIVLTNTSTSPFGGSGVNGDSNMVLSSLNFDLGGATITGGSVALTAGSSVVSKSGSSWGVVASGYDLMDEFGFSNTGIGNTGTGVLLGSLNALTSHSNGGTAVSSFAGDPGPIPGGLEYGLVATGSSPFGNSNFILNSVTFLLTLSEAFANLNFLENGSYVEFGSDYSFVTGICVDCDDPGEPGGPGDPMVPEPATIALLGMGLAGAGAIRRRGQRG